MKNRIIRYTAAGEITSLHCEFTRCTAQILGYGGNDLYIEKLKHSHIKISEHGETLKIKQTAKRFLRRAAVRIFVPEHCVPAVIVNAKNCYLEIEKGIYKNLNFRGENAEISVIDCTVENADILSENLKLNFSECSIKDALNAEGNGGILLEKSFIPKLNLRCKDGDIGIFDALIKSGAITLESGSVSATLRGKKEDYSLKLLTRQGICNRENTDLGENDFSVYAQSANIAVDFTEKVREIYYGNDGFTEDTRLSCET